jgi:hypothetical protein
VDLKWLLKAGAAGPFTVKDVQIREAHTMDIVAAADEVTVTMTITQAALLNKTLAAVSSLGYNNIDVDEKMLMGPRPANMPLSIKMNSSATHNLVLVHGYCTERNPFEEAYSGWTDPLFFFDNKASRSNDEFSNLVLDFIVSSGNPDSYSTAGHSQGGMVQLHMYHFYWTGIDNNGEGRKIQSLATPYNGCSGLAAMNSLSWLFGGCGDNTDLSVNGAANWLSQISTASRVEMYYYYTQGKSKQCSALTNMFIKKPNDGVTEVQYASLPGGNFLGMSNDECHGYNFAFPPSFLNQARDKEINDNSARPGMRLIKA